MGATTLGDLPAPEHSLRAPRAPSKAPRAPARSDGRAPAASQLALAYPQGNAPQMSHPSVAAPPLLSPLKTYVGWQLWRRWGSGKEAGKVERSRRKVAGKQWQSLGFYLVPREAVMPA